MIGVSNWGWSFSKTVPDTFLKPPSVRDISFFSSSITIARSVLDISIFIY